ncbi:hypothetical protein CDL15_Pgr010397 [Punica granatum]|uniref:Inhibitor of trypsin and hageman factor-like n=1 Tax=Punica granatum TaxID=22663 RepID=A0A218W1V0_PUNGR|nr:hypothetical protein CDL15_Pgr010397 [Punica granatum]
MSGASLPTTTPSVGVTNHHINDWRPQSRDWWLAVRPHRLELAESPNSARNWGFPQFRLVGLTGSHHPPHRVVGKNCWPELYGTSREKALAVIKRENPMVMASIVKEGTPDIMNYCCDRVWVWVDNSGVVVRVPTIG